MIYEFSELENKTISRCASWVTALGIITLVHGTLKVVAAIQLFFADNNTVLTEGIKAAYYLAVGVAFFLGGLALKRVVDTEGDDVPHMMNALRSVDRAFTFRIIAVVVMVGLFVVALLWLHSVLPA